MRPVPAVAVSTGVRRLRGRQAHAAGALGLERILVEAQALLERDRRAQTYPETSCEVTVLQCFKVCGLVTLHRDALGVEKGDAFAYWHISDYHLLRIKRQS